MPAPPIKFLPSSEQKLQTFRRLRRLAPPMADMIHIAANAESSACSIDDDGTFEQRGVTVSAFKPSRAVEHSFMGGLLGNSKTFAALC